MNNIKSIFNKLNMVEKTLLFFIPIISCTIMTIIIYNKIYINNFDVSKSGSTYLKNITIEGHNIKFSKKKYEYTIFLNNNETSLNITAEPVDRSANIKIVNNDDITSHDKVYIYVTSKDHKVRKYTINYNYRQSFYYYMKNIDNCNKIEANYCIKYFNIKDSKYKQSLLFTHDYINSNGYPNTNYITINDHKIFSKNLKNAEFRNINIYGNNIVLTYNNKNENKLSLYGFNVDGIVFFDYNILDEELKNINIYNVKYNKNNIYVKTRINNTSKKNICKLKDEDIVEVRYKINYKDNKFSKPIKTSHLTNLEYKILMNIDC